jgi:hypothetical protein
MELQFVRWLLKPTCQHEYREPTNINLCRPSVYCIHCGDIKKLPENHKWKKTNTTYIGGVRDSSGDVQQWQQRTFHLECEKCGDRKQHAA